MIRQDFNKSWSVGDAKTAFATLMGMRQGRVEKPVDLPHDAMILANRQKNSPTGGAGGFFMPQDCTYTKSFQVAAEDKGKVFFLEFEGAYMEAVVKVNGEYAGHCSHGYADFFVKINDFLKYGQDNEVSVTVLNSAQGNSRWYSGTGLYRNVKLLVGEPLYIVPDGLRVTTVDASPELATLRVETDIKNEHTTAETGYVSVVIKDTSGAIIIETAAKFHARSSEQITVEQTIFLHTPKLWNPDTPSLYSCEATVTVNDSVVDHDITTIGIRRLQLDPINGLRINGKPFKMKGGCVHHDNGVLGAATFEDAEERRVLMLKQAGYNAIRSAHNPTSKALLDACDKHGLMVMDEFTDVWTFAKNKYDYANDMPEHWERDLESMVRRDYNHPCVILYSIGNEIPDVGYEITSGIAREMIRKIRSIDRTRYITNGINPLIASLDRLSEIAMSYGAGDGQASGGEINEVMTNLGALIALINTSPIVDAAIEESCDMLDVVGYNYAAVRYGREHEKYPNRLFVGSETNPGALAENWSEVLEKPYLLGDFNWTAWDYLGEAGIGNIRYADTADQFYGAFPWVIAWCGDFDITGNRRPVSYWREIVWGGRNHVPYIAVQKPERYGQEPMPSQWSWTDSVSSWTWPGFEGKNAVVEVYSDAEEVELFVNGASQGKKPVGDEFKAFYCKWDTTYQAGEVLAVAYIGSAEVGRYCLKTAGKPVLVVTKERDCLHSGSNELCYVNVALCDVDGNLNTAADRELTFSIEGPATIQGSGSADPTTEENYFDLKHKSFYGRAIAVVRAGAKKGVATVTVTADGMNAATIEIPVS